ncbi:MAG: hypothetical protein WDK95_14435 [Syntrophorhabdaceae bacterium]
MINYKNKVKVGNKTFYFYECPECKAKRNLKKEGVIAALFMGGGTAALIAVIISLVGAWGIIPVAIVCKFGGEFIEKHVDKITEKFEDSKIQKKLTVLLEKSNLIRKLEKEGIALFKCPECGCDEILREE